MITFRSFFIVLFLTTSFTYVYGFPSNDTILKYKNNYKTTLANIAPVLVATGNQIYCPGTPTKIVTNMSITDPDDLGIDAIYIQISSGYVFGQDQLTLTGVHPTIVSSWDSIAGKLTLSGTGSVQPTYVNLENAIEAIEYSNNSPNPSGTRNFSITVGQANYLPSNGHYYQYISNFGITWSNAKVAAQSSTYYGLQGYLATITSLEEAQIAGEQASGAGWIGGSDEETEGVWKWMTGPELGLVFWNGGVNGSSPNYEYWNNGEPNDNNNEDYAHITAPGVGIPGSWNDLSNSGAVSGDYQPKGYIVEYGGLPGDPILQISTSTTITIPAITTTQPSSRCGNGSVTLGANASNGMVTWYANSTGGLPLATGNSFSTPILSTTTTYFATAFSSSCVAGTRTPITATINEIPVLLISNVNPICENNVATLLATSSAGIVNWYNTPVGGSPIAVGGSYTTQPLTQTTTFYAEGSNNGCLSLTRVAVEVVVNSTPNVQDETIILCENTTKIISAGALNTTYLWSTGATSESISITAAGIYTVVVTSPSNCSATKTITVLQYDIPEIEQVAVNENTVTIIAAGFGELEFSVDGINYQDSNTFTILEGGLYTAVVRSKTECGQDFEPFIVLSIPKFFTPNSDGINDTFFVKGMIFYPNATLRIFDRFGKNVAVINTNSNSWDGNYEGQKLPSSDYWYTIRISNDLPEIRGHFSLKR